jgi:hypothetical protein
MNRFLQWSHSLPAAHAHLTELFASLYCGCDDSREMGAFHFAQQEENAKREQQV